jgi:hypothetical protein
MKIEGMIRRSRLKRPLDVAVAALLHVPGAASWRAPERGKPAVWKQG